MIRLSLLGHEVDVPEGTDLLTACLGHGVDVPHFCWHEALGSVGACRLCAVHVTHPDGTAGLKMACMTESAPGLAVDPAHEDAIRFRAQVIEWLLAAHPHDCAVCEAGGACHLQDMAALSGHHHRRVGDPKRHHARQDLGPFLTHEMNRCIACYRCTRFYRDFAGGRDFAAFGSQARVWFGRARPGPLESPFAGNLAELCPTGVFNDRAWSQAYARPWDMERTPAICTRCAVGCNITLHARDGRMRKAEARFHAALNRHFLCDRGRFGVHAVHGPQRAGEGASLADARRLIAGGAIGLGSPHASLEANLALREVVGPARFFTSSSDERLALDRRMLGHLAATPARRADLADMASADAVLLMACDLVAEAPLAALMLRQASRAAERTRAAAKGVPPFLDEAVRTAGEGARAPFILLSPEESALDSVATHLHRLPPSALLELAQAILAALRGEGGTSATRFAAEARDVAQTLSAARSPLILVTAGLGDSGLVDTAAAIAGILAPKAALAFLPAEANAFGLPLLEPRGGLQSALELGEATGLPLVALEPGGALSLLETAAASLVRLDWLAPGPGLLLPVAAPEESAGLFINFEGRLQESHAALPASAPWAPTVLADLAETSAPSLATLRARLRAACPALGSLPPTIFQPLSRAAPGLSGRTASDRAGRLAEAVPPPAGAGESFTWGLEGSFWQEVPEALRPDWTGDGLHSPSSSYRAALGRSPAAPPGDQPAPGSVLDLSSFAPHAAHAAPDGGAARPVAGLEAIPVLDPFVAGARDTASPWLAARLAAGPTAPPAPALHPDEAMRLGLQEGMQLLVDGRPVEGALRLDPGLAPGVIRLPGSAMPEGRRRVVVGPAP